MAQLVYGSKRETSTPFVSSIVPAVRPSATTSSAANHPRRIPAFGGRQGEDIVHDPHPSRANIQDRVDCIIIVPMDFGDHKRELEKVAIDAAFEERDACADIARDVMVGNVEIPRDGMQYDGRRWNSSWTRYGAGYCKLDQPSSSGQTLVTLMKELRAECQIDLSGPAANDEKVLERCLHKLARAISVFYFGQRTGAENERFVNLSRTRDSDAGIFAMQRCRSEQ